MYPEVGGIQEKVIAARRENVKTVLMWVTSFGGTSGTPLNPVF
jgi:ATP-dependent Lon protease